MASQWSGLLEGLFATKKGFVALWPSTGKAIQRDGVNKPVYL